MKATRARTAAVFMVAALGLGVAGAFGFAPRSTGPPAREEFSPLFARRLDVGLRNMDEPPGRVRLAILNLHEADPLESIFSFNPVSACIVSQCGGSVCLGSACALSACFGSACGGSACPTSACSGSACSSSGCSGSACAGSGCFGSACAGSGCIGSFCVMCAVEREPGETEALHSEIGEAAPSEPDAGTQT